MDVNSVSGLRSSLIGSRMSKNYKPTRTPSPYLIVPFLTCVFLLCAQKTKRRIRKHSQKQSEGIIIFSTSQLWARTLLLFINFSVTSSTHGPGTWWALWPPGRRWGRTGSTRWTETLRPKESAWSQGSSVRKHTNVPQVWERGGGCICKPQFPRDVDS